VLTTLKPGLSLDQLHSSKLLINDVKPDHLLLFFCIGLILSVQHKLELFALVLCYIVSMWIEPSTQEEEIICS